jgi:hypothetical protein
MATTTAKKKDAAADAASPIAVEAATGPDVAPAQAQQAVVFRDKEFTSRTLFMPDQRPVVVAAGRVTTADANVAAFLQGHKDFERLE